MSTERKFIAVLLTLQWVMLCAAHMGWGAASRSSDHWRSLAYSYKHEAKAAKDAIRRAQDNLEFAIETIEQRCKP